MRVCILSFKKKRCFWKQVYLLCCLFIFLFPAGTTHAQFYQGTQTSFGKNGVQYIDFLWTYYRYKYYDVYFYVGGKDLALYVSQTAEKELKDIEKLFDYRLEGRMQFIVFNKLSDLKQSNIGLEPEPQGNTGGFTKISGNRVFIYFDGNHENFLKQIRAGIAQVLLDQIMFGGDVRERLQNAAMLTLPSWYTQGLVSYVSEEWSTSLDDRMRDGVQDGRYKKFNRLTGKDAICAGHSIWKYIVDVYGESSLSNLLYMTRVNRNVESGFLYVLGVSLKSFSKEWIGYYEKKHLNAQKGRAWPAQKPLLKRTKATRIYSHLSLSPDGAHVVYVTNELGRYKIWLADSSASKKKKILKSGYKAVHTQTDESFPLITWHPSGDLIAYIRERKGKILLGYYDVKQKKSTESPLLHFEKILSVSYSDNGQDLLLSAVQNGRSDIFVYNLRTRTYVQITKDFYDDLYPRFVLNSKAIAFASNRTNDTLGAEEPGKANMSSNLDLFLYDYAGKSTLLKRVTATALANETHPVPYDSLHFGYLSDESGICNRYIARMDSVLSFVDTVEHYRYVVENHAVTNYAANILDHDINPRSGKYAEILFRKGKYRLFTGSLAPASGAALPGNPEYTAYRSTQMALLMAPRKDTIPQKIQQSQSFNIPPRLTPAVTQTPPDTSLAPPSYYFINGFRRLNADSSASRDTLSRMQGQATVDTLKKSSVDSAAKAGPLQRNYDPAYYPAYFVSQFDNSLLNSTYQAFSGGNAVYFNPGLNALFKIGISDLMEDYRITGAFRVAADMGSSEYLVSYENLKKRLDKQVLFYRQGRTYTDPAGMSSLKIHTSEIKYLLKWPFSDIVSVRATFSFRNDRSVPLSTDYVNLLKKNTYANWGSVKAEYVFDNTMSTGLNLYNGLRLKVFAEAFKQLDNDPRIFRPGTLSQDSPWLLRGVINETKTSRAELYVLGLDLRYYLKVHRDLIWANRIAGSTSLGTRKLIYYLGSLDNWLLSSKGTPRFDNSMQIDYAQNYAYQALVTNMRGFSQNIRNGSNFVVINSELRWPVFKYLMNRPVKSDFFRNFQIVGFGDVGTAWTGSSPYAEGNSLNTQVITSGPLKVTIINQREPIVAGYGYGLRSRLFGYFIRADWARGYEDGVKRPRIFYLSLSLDF